MNQYKIGSLLFWILAFITAVPFTRWTVIAFQDWPLFSWFTLIINEIMVVGIAITAYITWHYEDE